MLVAVKAGRKRCRAVAARESRPGPVTLMGQILRGLALRLPEEVERARRKMHEPAGSVDSMPVIDAGPPPVRLTPFVGQAACAGC
ncbi:hypothetical protein GCM10027452_00050 [Micromonospora halotolerans]